MNMLDIPHYSRNQLSVFDGLPSSVLINVLNDEGQMVYVYSNAFLANSLGYEHEEFEAMLRKECFAAIYEADREKTMNARAEVFNGNIVDSITRQKKKDGSFVWILAHIRLIDLDGRTGMLFLFSSISELIGLQNQLLESSQRWNDILQSVPVGLLVYQVENGVRTTLSVNRFLLDFANSVGQQLDSRRRAWTEAEFTLIINMNIYAFSEEEDIPKVKAMLEGSKTRPTSECTFKIRGSGTANPVYVFATCTSKQIRENCRIYYVTFQNVTELENNRQELTRKQEELYKLSYYDSLTGVKNRNAYNELVENCWDHRLNNVGVVFSDINGLKKTNDTLGHYYGDQMLNQFSDILRRFFRPDHIYRISGDEFVVICPDISRDEFHEKVAELIRCTDDENYLASIGYIWEEHTSDIAKVIALADQIMYVQKQKYYGSSMDVLSRHRPHMLDTLLHDFKNGYYQMYLQPKVSIDGREVIGAEALVRKCVPGEDIILPYQFIPLLEHEKMIPRLDYYMLDKSCRFLQDLERSGGKKISVSTNISRVTIVENDFIKTVASIIGSYQFDHSCLELELTESNKTLDAIRLKEYLIRLKKLGVKISLDDMGTDYSTLTLITLEGFDWVKLDRSLILQLNRKKDRVLVKHIIETCHDLNLKVIAEGVETDKTRQILMELNCDAYQGFLKSKPVPEEKFIGMFLTEDNGEDGSGDRPEDDGNTGSGDMPEDE